MVAVFFDGAFLVGVFLVVAVLAEAFLAGVFLVVVLAGDFLVVAVFLVGAFAVVVFLADAALLVDDFVFFEELLLGAAFRTVVVFFGAVDMAAACLALAANLTLPLTPLGSRNTPLSLPRTIALFKCVVKEAKGSFPVLGCLARITFFNVGRPRPDRPSSPYEAMASIIMSSYVMLDGFFVLLDFLVGAMATVDLALVGAMLENTTG